MRNFPNLNPTCHENHQISCSYSSYRLLAVKAGTSRVGHLSPSARGLQANDFHRHVGVGSIYLLFGIGYLSQVSFYKMHFFRAIAFKKPCACNHSICCWSSHRKVSSLVAIYRASIVPSFFLKQDIFRWK